MVYECFKNLESRRRNLTEKQIQLYRHLMNAIAQTNEVSSADAERIFEDVDIQDVDIQKVLSMDLFIETEKAKFTSTFLIYAIGWEQKNIAKIILEKANSGTLKKLLTQESGVEYDEDGNYSLRSHTALSYVEEHRESFGEEFVNMIKQKKADLDSARRKQLTNAIGNAGIVLACVGM